MVQYLHFGVLKLPPKFWRNQWGGEFSTARGWSAGIQRPHLQLRGHLLLGMEAQGAAGISA